MQESGSLDTCSFCAAFTCWHEYDFFNPFNDTTCLMARRVYDFQADRYVANGDKSNYPASDMASSGDQKDNPRKRELRKALILQRNKDNTCTVSPMESSKPT